MLALLRIENFAIAESAELKLAPGLNAITGETGAGKSVLVGALELALGGRASSDVVRAGERLAVVEAAFEPPVPKRALRLIRREWNLEWDEAEPLVVRREISAQGRTRCFIAGQLVNVAELRALGETLVDLHGQHEHQSLFHLAAQREAVDAFGGHEAVLAKYRESHARFVDLRDRKALLEQEAHDFEKRLDYLDFQIAEIDEAAPAEGESESLEAEETRLAHAEALAEAAQRGYAVLYESEGDERSVLAALRETERALGQAAEHDSRLTDLVSKAAEIQALVEDLALALRDYATRSESDPARLAELGDRIAALQRLRRKHGAADDAALVRMLESMRAERERMMRDDREREEISAALEAASEEMTSRAEELGSARRAAARKLAKAVVKTLAQVGMEKAVFEILIEPAAEFTADGRDRVEFMLAANVGEGRHALREAASGGELSRTMLAIKTALAERDAISTLVFDEIDAGISGETAARVGAVMHQLGESHQVVCITHHASIAARAAHHVSVRKETRGGRTTMTALALAKNERVEELARLMGGDAASEAGKKLARQLMAGSG